MKWSGSAKHIGSFKIFPPSHKTFFFEGYAYFKIKENLIVETIIVSNAFLNMLHQNISLCFDNNQNPYNLITEQDNNISNSILSTIKDTLNNALTDKEILVASLWLSGYSIKESSSIINLSQKTIEKYRYNIKHKLNVSHKKHLYAFLKRSAILDLLFFLYSKK